ncbi:unnamed protein product, partial [Polarella glacialis]
RAATSSKHRAGHGQRQQQRQPAAAPPAFELPDRGPRSGGRGRQRRGPAGGHWERVPDAGETAGDGGSADHSGNTAQGKRRTPGWGKTAGKFASRKKGARTPWKDGKAPAKDEKGRTGPNQIEVDWRPPVDDVPQGVTPKSGMPKKPSPVRGPAGRGRPVPGWMNSLGGSSSGVLALPAPGDAPGASVASRSPVRGPAGRGRGSVLPAWMSRDPASSVLALPSIPSDDAPPSGSAAAGKGWGGGGSNRGGDDASQEEHHRPWSHEWNNSDGRGNDGNRRQ